MIYRFPQRIRSASLDRMIVLLWTGMLILCQIILPSEVTVLEWVSVALLTAGVILVNRTMCLPLVLMTCPAFMCESHRVWAWVQVFVVVVLLLRIVVEERFFMRQYVVIAAVGVLVAFFSWPSGAIGLLDEVHGYSLRQIWNQWFHPQAISAIFPFRQLFDRSVFALVCTAAVIHGGYVSTPRLWNALKFVVLMSLMATIAVTILPWQQPHKFLGTTNFAINGNYLFPGAGYNLCYITLILSIGVCVCFVPVRSRWSMLLVAFPILLLPTVFDRELAYYLSFVVVGIAALLFLVHALSNRNRRMKLLERISVPLCSWSTWFLALAAIGAVGLWFNAVSKAETSVPMKDQWAQMVKPFLPDRNVQASVAVVPSESALLAEAPGLANFEVAAEVPHVSYPHSVTARVKALMLKQDEARARMWFLGLRHALDNLLLIGEGAGTWPRFHKSQMRRGYFAHMHNTYLDIIFEYGVLPAAVLFVVAAFALIKLLLIPGWPSRIWILYFAGAAVTALGQHVFFAFSTTCLLLPAAVILPRALLKKACAGSGSSCLRSDPNV